MRAPILELQEDDSRYFKPACLLVDAYLSTILLVDHNRWVEGSTRLRAYGDLYWIHHGVDLDLRDMSKIRIESSLASYIESFIYSVLFPLSSLLVPLEMSCLIVLRATCVLHLPRIPNGDRQLPSRSRK